MRFTKTPLEGVVVVDVDTIHDDRGFFSRVFCEDEFGSAGLHNRMPQWNVSYNERRGTLRGLHYEPYPTAESKLVRCGTGSVFDVVVDVRHGSSTFLHWFGLELSRANRSAVFIPPGCAHGFLTLSDDVDVWYAMGSAFRPGTGLGLRWDDPNIGIEWPITPTVISTRDANYPDYEPLLPEERYASPSSIAKDEASGL